MNKFRNESDEVLYFSQDPVILNRDNMIELKRLALLNPSQRIRICTHQSIDDELHEMFIVHTNNCYVRPHKHLNKTESISILEGEVDIILFRDNGTILKVFYMGDSSTGKPFYHRLDKPIYHMLIIKTDFLVFHEVTNGPFNRLDTSFPEWAPEEYDDIFVEKIKRLANIN